MKTMSNELKFAEISAFKKRGNVMPLHFIQY